jgi:hypothetical protein
MIYENINSEYSIVTLPRVGSFYLQDRILQHTGVYVKKYHSFKDNKMITIARDPVDALTSKLAMTVFYDNINKSNETINEIRSNKITKDVQDYIDGAKMTILEKDFYAIIDYKDLVNRPLATTEAIANIMGLEIVSRDYEMNRIKGDKRISHIVSSRRVEEYAEIRHYVQNLDLSFLYGFYDKAISLSIKPE